jgi:hypothetical protein
MWEISAMENTVGVIVTICQRVPHSEFGRFETEQEARDKASELGERYFPWLA